MIINSRKTTTKWAKIKPPRRKYHSQYVPLNIRNTARIKTIKMSYPASFCICIQSRHIWQQRYWRNTHLCYCSDTRTYVLFLSSAAAAGLLKTARYGYDTLLYWCVYGLLMCFRQSVKLTLPTVWLFSNFTLIVVIVNLTSGPRLFLVVTVLWVKRFSLLSERKQIVCLSECSFVIISSEACRTKVT